MMSLSALNTFGPQSVQSLRMGQAHRLSSGHAAPSWQLTGRYAAALQILGIDEIVSSNGVAAIGREGETAGSSRLRDLAADYKAAFAEAKNRPGISDANARHIGQYETIMANRAEFPPGEFYIHTELGDGASITTRIPPMGGGTVTAVSATISHATLVLPADGGQPSVTLDAVKASYLEFAA